MESAESIVYLSAWVALACYPAAGVGRGTDQPSLQLWARIVWTAGCVVFGLHVVTAFGVFYDWSHSTALSETARQTRDSTGFDSGAGLYLNYLFALLWIADAAWWWRRPDRYRHRSLQAFLLLHGFFLFMIVNGAVIFVDGPRRWLGAAIFMEGVASVGWAVARNRGREAP